MAVAQLCLLLLLLAWPLLHRWHCWRRRWRRPPLHPQGLPQLCPLWRAQPAALLQGWAWASAWSCGW
jgi:hypothetical protein